MTCNSYNNCPHLAKCIGRKKRLCSTVNSLLKHGILDVRTSAKNLGITEEMTDHELAQEIVKRVEAANNKIMSLSIGPK